MNLLLFSNSTNPGEPYFSYPEPYVKDFLGKINRTILFIPYAAVDFSFDEYFEKVSSKFVEWGYATESVHNKVNKREAIREAGVIVVGGGNSFALLNRLYEADLISEIKDKLKNGGYYIGWSAGSNMACPTLKTTNDMPIVFPPSFEALHLIPFQINPHYTEKTIPGHGGESRDQRIKEFLVMNQSIPVIGLPEGSLLEHKDNKLEYKGVGTAILFKYGESAKQLEPGIDLSYLL